MITTTFKHGAIALGLAGALSLAAVTPSSAQWRGGHWGWGGAAIGAGIAGFALGAAVASTAAPYYAAPYGYDGYYGYAPGYYGYAPGVVAVAPGPVYYDYYAYDPYWGRRPGRCRLGIRGC